MNSKIITPVFTGIQQCEALLPPFERACTAAIDVSGGSVQELIYSDKKVTRPGFSNGDAGLMTLRALDAGGRIIRGPQAKSENSLKN